MNPSWSPLFPQSSDDSGPELFLRWRGKQEGPYSPAIIDRKLAAGEVGLLHEVFLNGTWRSLRDYLAEREAMRQAEILARQEAERAAHEAEARAVRERQEQERVAAQAEEKRKNDLLEQVLSRQKDLTSRPSSPVLLQLRPHRSGTVLAFSLIGLLVCFPFSIAAWSMGSADLQQMDAGIMDSSGRSSTSSGRVIGIVGTILWGVGLLFYLLAGAANV